MVAGIEPSRCNISGHDIVYYRTGRGEPVLLVHGITTYSFLWRNILPQLAKNHDVIAVDLLGCGSSDMPLNISYAIKDHAEYLHQFVTALDLPRFHFVGHDLGGGMGQIFAINHPDLLLDLALLNTVGYDFWPVQPITAMRTPIVRQLLMATLDLGMLRKVVEHGIYNKDRVTEELMAQFMAPFNTKQGRKAFLHFARCLDNHNLTEIEDKLRELDLPVLIIRGQEDPYLSSDIASKLHREIQGSKLTILPEASHFLQEDAPDAVVSELESFFGNTS